MANNGTKKDGPRGRVMSRASWARLDRAVERATRREALAQTRTLPEGSRIALASPPGGVEIPLTRVKGLWSSAARPGEPPRGIGTGPWKLLRWGHGDESPA